MLKVGDVVQLKSGGPKMTVSAVQDTSAEAAAREFGTGEFGPDGASFSQILQAIEYGLRPPPPPVIWCVWFEGTKKMSGDFALAMLEKVS